MGWWLLAGAVAVLALVAWRMKRSTAASAEDSTWTPRTFDDTEGL